MTMHIRDEDDERVLFVERTGNTDRAIIVQFDTHDCGGKWHYRFDLTDVERKALIQALTLPTAAPAPECFHDDCVPGCDHNRPIDWFDVGVAIIAPELADPPLEGPPWDDEDELDAMDDPHGHREPAF